MSKSMNVYVYVYVMKIWRQKYSNMKPLCLCNGLYGDGDDRTVELRTISATLVY
jgi:hypothetical protein